MKYLFNGTIAGWCYRIAGEGEQYYLQEDGSFAYISANVQSSRYDGSYTTVTLTGRYTTSSRGTVMYETIDGYWIDLNDGWQKYQPVAIATQTAAQAIVNRIIAADRKIIANNLLCARFAYRLTPEQRAELYNLQTRLQNRQDALKNDGLCSDIKTGYPEGYSELESYLSNFMASGGVGIATWAIVVVAAVVIASLSAAAYFAYQAYAQEAENDVKYSQELTKVLASKLTEEEYQQLLSETKGIVTKSRIKQSLSSYSKVIGIVLAAVGGYLLLTKFKKGRNNEAK